MAARWRGEAVMEGCRSRQKSKETDKQTGIADVQQRRSVSLTANSFKWHGGPFRLHWARFINTVHFLPSSSPSVLPLQEQKCSVSLFRSCKNPFQTFIFLLWVTHFPHLGLIKALYCIVTPVWNEPQNTKHIGPIGHPQNSATHTMLFWALSK